VSSSIVPQKRCTKCFVFKDATLEFFHRYRDGLRSQCRDCVNIYRRKKLAENPEKNRENAREWARRNPERNRARVKQWAIDNPEKVLEYSRKYYAKNRLKANEATGRWRKRNPERSLQHVYLRLSRKNQVANTLTSEQWSAALAYFNGCCAYCGSQQSFWHVIEKEHFIPLTKGGGYTASNIIPSCRECNSSKNNRDADVWAVTKFGKQKANRIMKRIEAYFKSLEF
jgi:5-methylcytosine-specific restriction endonuclease McrA